LRRAARALDPAARGARWAGQRRSPSAGQIKEINTMEHGVIVHVELNAAQAWALAQLLKRIGWGECRALAEDEEQTRLMIAAIERVRAGLAEAGYAPR
jgi:hypothetical protein